MEVDWYTVTTDGWGRHIVVAPDGITWEQIYPTEQMREADLHAAQLNRATWLALEPRIPAAEPGEAVELEPQETLLAIIDQPWLGDLEPTDGRPYDWARTAA